MTTTLYIIGSLLIAGLIAHLWTSAECRRQRRLYELENTPGGIETEEYRRITKLIG